MKVTDNQSPPTTTWFYLGSLMWECGSPDKCSCGLFICISCRGFKVRVVSEPRPVLCRTVMSDANLCRTRSQRCSCHHGRLGTALLNVLSPGSPVSLSAAINNKDPPLLLVSRRCVSSIRRQLLVTLELEEATSPCPLVCPGHLLSTLSQGGVSHVLSLEHLASCCGAGSNSTLAVDCQLSEFMNNL